MTWAESPAGSGAGDELHGADRWEPWQWSPPGPSVTKWLEGSGQTLPMTLDSHSALGLGSSFEAGTPMTPLQPLPEILSPVRQVEH